MALSTIDVISTSIKIVNSQGCTFSINQRIMMNGTKRSTFSTLGKRGNGKPTTTTKKPSAGPHSTIPAASAASASKLSLAKSLQEALTTMAGLSENQFNKIWANACSASGN